MKDKQQTSQQLTNLQLDNMNCDQLNQLAEDYEATLRQIYRAIYKIGGKDKRTFENLTLKNKNWILNSTAACWEAWVLRKEENLSTVDTFALAQRWMKERSAKIDGEVTLHDIVWRFQQLKNKRLSSTN
jgi:hypothetical protein